jgi:dolichol-phosphate mannosyltransferase
MFLAVGLSGVVVDMTILYLLHHNLDLPLTRSKILAGEVAIINNFLWNDRWTFSDVSMRQKGKRQQLRRFIKFNLVCLMGLVLNVIILNIFYNIFMLKVVPYGAYIANFIAIACVTVWNFWISVKLSWRVTDRQT